jgi:hypothetical protein
MVVFGDPTLCIPTPVQMKILKPEKALYIGDKEIMPFITPVSIGKITIETFAASNEYGIDKVEFYVDNTLKETVTSEPYAWIWTQPAFFKHTIKVVAYNTMGQNATREFIIWKFF